MNTFKYAKETFDGIYGPLPIPVILFDDKASLVKANQSFLDLARAGTSDLQALSMVSLFKDLTLSFERELSLRIGFGYYTTALTCLDGNSIPVKLDYIKLNQDGGLAEGALGFISDLTEISSAKEKIKELTLENEACKEQQTGKPLKKILSEKASLEKDLFETKVFLENVLESCGDGIISAGTDGTITMSNESFAGILGKTKPEIVGLSHYDLGPMVGEFKSTTGETVILDKSYADYQESQLEKMMKLIDEDGGKVENWDFYAYHKNGNIVPIEFTVSLRKNVQGTFMGTVVSARNLTNKRLAEKEIKESKDFLEKVIEASYDGIVVSDMEGVVLLTNSGIERITGYSKEELVGNRFSDVVGIKTTPEGIKKRITGLYEKRQKSFETSIRNKNGERVYLEHGLSLVKDNKGEGTLLVSIIRDITEKKKAARKLEEAYQFRSQFFTNITHAFRTPLTLAIGPLEGILRGEFGKVNQDINEQLGLALKNSRQLLKLINQLLDFSRLDSGKRSLVYVEKDLEKLIAAVLDSFAFIARKKKIKLLFIPGRNIPYISIDPAKMEKALFNLVGNAFKFTPEKGQIRVAIEKVKGSEGTNADRDEFAMTNHEPESLPGQTESEYVRVSIIDNGIGIKKDDLIQIFDRFKQGARSVDQGHGGTGIGLAHAKEIIELMQGRITVKSEYGKGSRFSIYLPVERDTDVQPLKSAERTYEGLTLQPDVELSDVHQEKKVLEDRISGQKPLILILDDNPDVLHYISVMVKKDYDFMTAGSGSEGLKKMGKHRPEVILCDIMMPEMDGHEFLKRVRSNPELSSVSFIFLTARADTEMKIEGLEEGADDYIVKPFNSLELLARIKSLLRIRTLLNKTAVQEKKISSLNQKLQGKYSYGSIVGRSPAMRKIYQLLETIKESDSTILITGETGTGKELIANSIHYNSPRKKAPLISVNCGAIPKELMEREFFGHVKGAYTGAVESKKGYFQAADLGTLFLDEIGEMDRDMQVKLLRVLERGEIVRVGESVSGKVDVRLIAATNKDLRAEVQKGNFREDLYYRIHVIPIHIPPLRQRSEDIPPLIEHFLQKCQLKLSKEMPALSENDLSLFMGYAYPGNVRELEHIVERFCLLGGNLESLFNDLAKGVDELAGDFPYDELLSSTNPLRSVAQKAKTRAEGNLIKHTLKLCNNDFSEAASMLNIGLSSLYRKLKEMDN